jgi:3-deoxy-7-phosphoheptulonate synthase
MSSRVTDLHVARNIPLPSPARLQAEIPRGDRRADFVSQSRAHLRTLLSGNDSRFLVIVGPCSIHDTEAGLEYAHRLAALAERLRDKLYLVMRVYFEKPRTTVGWKGLIMDPHLDGTDDIPEGLRRARHFLRSVIDLGLPTATELLDPITPQYIADLISWSAIGARTAESLIPADVSRRFGGRHCVLGHHHRQSGLPRHPPRWRPRAELRRSQHRHRPRGAARCKAGTRPDRRCVPCQLR